MQRSQSDGQTRYAGLGPDRLIPEGEQENAVGVFNSCNNAALDGIYVVRTSLPAAQSDTASTVRAYKSLAGVEHAFRSIKTVDLELRPVFHWTAPRVRAHVLLCMLAYYLE
jgi:hypothetical protein